MKNKNKEIKVKFNMELILGYISKHKLTVQQFCSMCEITTGEFEMMQENNLDINIVSFLKVANFLRINPAKLLIE